ncbi:hypothetical protein Tco_0867144 [Tanacetum coccineum]
MYRPPFEPSRQEEFAHIVMNFIFDQKERITQLEDYMKVIVEELKEFSSEVTRRLKERVKENENKPRKIEKITKYPDTKVLENSAKHEFIENLKKKTFPTPANLLCVRYVRLIHSNPPQPWKNIFGFKYGERANMSRMNLHKGVTFRLGGVEREMSLLELGWRVSLYSEGESRDVATLSGLRGTEIVNSTRLTHLVWPSIGDGRFNVGNTKEKSIRNPRIELSDRCITMTITGRKETTNRGMFVTRIARSFGLLTNEMVSVLNREPPPHVYRKTSLVKMGVIKELHEGEFCCRTLDRLWRKVKVMMRKAMEKGKRRSWGLRGHLPQHEPRLYLMRKSLEDLRKFHWMILG